MGAAEEEVVVDNGSMLEIVEDVLVNRVEDESPEEESAKSASASRSLIGRRDGI